MIQSARHHGARDGHHCSVLAAVVVIAGLLPLPAVALDPSLLKPQTLTAPQPVVRITLPPNITTASPSCVNKGGTLTVQGNYFGSQSGRALALSGPTHVDLTATSWAASQINAIVPNTPDVQAGKTYNIGIENAGHAGWVSNTNVTVTICASLVSLVPTTRIILNPALRTMGPAGGTPAPGGGGTEPSPTPEGTGETPIDPGTAMQAPAGGSPALLGSQLPSPPADLPPPPPRHDKRSEPGEIVVVSANMAEAMALQQQAQGLGLSVKRRTPLKELGLVVTVLRVPKEVSVGNAIESLRQAQPNIWVDANHRLGLHGADARYGHRLIGIAKPVAGCGDGIRIGLIDTAIDTKHPALAGQSIVTQSFLTTGVTPASADHGTATAALLVGKPMPNGFSGLVPGARLYAATVFRHQDDRGADATAESIVKALNWLAGQNVQIINLNFGGQRNLLLEAAIDRLIKRGIVVVVAVGNDSSDTPTWPAAQSGVIVVTAVDDNGKIYSKANRGKHVGFAAPGVDIWSAAAGKDGKTHTGTSYAAPFVTAILAMSRKASPATPWPTLIKQLQTSARDLGDNGHDPVYGWGLIQAPAGCRGR